MKPLVMLYIAMMRAYSLLDRTLLIPFVNFDTYFAIHKKLGFPLKKFYFKRAQGYSLNLDNPVTFNDKVVYRQLFERDPLLVKIADKYAVREYVKEKIGEKYLIPLIQVADSFDAIEFSQLPDDYAMKMNHASGRNIIVKNGIIINGYIKEKLKNTIDNWFSEKYKFQKLIWFVQPIKRKIIVEKLLKDDKGSIPKDYKFFVFDGKVEFILVVHSRFTGHSINLYDRNWKVADFTIEAPSGNDPIGPVEEKPVFLTKMVDLAEKLTADFNAMRVDFYIIGSKIYFGELTPCHGGAVDKFIPVQYDKYYGHKWKIQNHCLEKRTKTLRGNKRNEI